MGIQVIPIFLAALIVGGASALALSTIGSSFAYAETPAGEVGKRQSLLQSDDLLNSHIAHFKALLRLTAAQEQHWQPVESALRDVARHQVAEEASEGGIIQRTGERVAEFALSAAALRRLVSAAQPLVDSLDQEQKRDAVILARNMGFGSVADKFK